jgi:hypothetical protein
MLILIPSSKLPSRNASNVFSNSGSSNFDVFTTGYAIFSNSKIVSDNFDPIVSSLILRSASSFEIKTSNFGSRLI